MLKYVKFEILYCIIYAIILHSMIVPLACYCYEHVQTITITKEDIQNFFKYTMKKCPDRAIELFIKQVRVYDNKIEIYLNYFINQPQTVEQTYKKFFTETLTTQRTFKGGTTRTYTKIYDVYVVI